MKLIKLFKLFIVELQYQWDHWRSGRCWFRELWWNAISTAWFRYKHGIE